MLRGLYLANWSGYAATVRMAVMSILTGSPGSSNAFLLWDYVLASGGGYFEWTGRLPFVDRYLYISINQGTVPVSTVWENLTAA